MKTTYWMDKNVFVSGASGFLGSHLTKALVERGAKVTILLRDTVPQSLLFRLGLLNKVNVVRARLENFWSVERTLNEYEIDTVFHIGAQAIVQTANRSPLPTFEANIRGTYNILEACRSSKIVARIVVASSDKAYGTQKTLPYTEETPLQGQHPYDVSKSCADLLAQAYFKTYGLPIGITRCGNIYGAGDLNFNRIIPGTIKSVFYKEPPLIRSDGTYVRDYVYIEDIVHACLTLAGSLDRKEIHGHAFNFSTKNKKSVLEVVQAILRIMRSNLRPKILNEAKSEIQKQYLSSHKAQSMLGWKAKYELEEGLKKTIPWYINYFKSQNRKSY